MPTGLPPDRAGVYWKNWEITTPSFDLTSIEKPDMSPFLVHMTGKNALKSILERENAPPDLLASVMSEDGVGDSVQTSEVNNYGFIKASIPLVQAKGPYSAAVVCFTESPLFAIDFFRYRKFDRWKNDNAMYGIGFSKSTLVQRGTRPVLYLDEERRQMLFDLDKLTSRYHSELSDTTTSIAEQLKSLFANLYPLIFPLLENRESQGFMWEREWRYPYEPGLVFHYDDIRIICCPQNEQPALEKILGLHVQHTTFVRNWDQYNEVSHYLERQEAIWQQQGQASQISALSKTILALEQYEIVIERLAQQQQAIEAQKIELQKKQKQVRLDMLRNDWADILDTVRVKCGLKQQAALGAVKDIAVDDDQLTLNWSSNRFAKSVVEEKGTLDQLTTLLKDHLRWPTLQIKCNSD